MNDSGAAPFSTTVTWKSTFHRGRALAWRIITSHLVLVSGALVLLVIIFFYDIVFLGRTLLSSSIVWGVMGTAPPYDYPGGAPAPNPYLLDPLAHAVGESTARKIASVYQDLQIPLWDANTALGRPLLGSLDPQAVDPLRLPIVLSPSPAVWDAFLIARFPVAGLFTYLFAQRLGTTRLAASAAAVAFIFSGFFMLFINGSPPDFAMLIPVLLYAFDLLFERRNARTIVFAAVAVALAALNGNPETTFVLLLFGTAYYLARILTEAYRQGSVRPLRRSLPLGICLSIGMGLSAFALLPFIELTGVLNLGGLSAHLHAPERDLGLTYDSLRYLMSLFVPYFDGAPVSTFQATGWTGIRNYVGVVVSLLAFIGLANRRLMGRGGWFFAIAAILLVAKTYGVGAVNWVGHLPVFNVLFFAVYFAPVIAFSMAILAALGIDQLSRGGVRTWHALVAMAVLVALLGWLIWLNRGILDSIPRDHLARHVGIALFLVVSASGAILAVTRGFVSARLVSILLVALTCGELFFFSMPGRGYFGGIGPKLYGDDLPVQHRPDRYDPFTEPPYVSFLKQDTSTYRVFSPEYFLYPMTSSVYGIDDIRGYTATTIERYLVYIQNFINPTTVQRFTGAPLPPLGSETQPPSYAGNPLFDLLNVKYIIAGSGLTEVHDHSFIDAVLDANPNEPGVELRAFRIQGEDEAVLSHHPPSSLSYTFTPSEQSKFLLFRLGLNPKVWSPELGDGVLFEVSVVERKTSETVFSRWVDPKNRPTDRRWIGGAVDLGPYLGKQVTLVLSTSPGAAPVWDWAGWGDLRLAPSPQDPPDRASSGQFELVYEGEVNIYENRTVLPRAFIVHRAVSAAGQDAAIALMRGSSFDPSKEAIVEGNLTQTQLATLAASPAKDGSSVEITRYRDTKVELQASVENPGLLVLSDTYYPGWKAYVDGQKTPIYATNLALRSIYLEPGEHHIRFEYDPASFRLGYLISGASLLLLLSYAALAPVRAILATYKVRRS